MHTPPVQVAIAALGSMSRLAYIAGVSRRTVRRWKKSGQIPVKYLLAVLVPCAMKGVTAEELIAGRNEKARE